MPTSEAEEHCVLCTEPLEGPTALDTGVCDLCAELEPLGEEAVQGLWGLVARWKYKAQKHRDKERYARAGELDSCARQLEGKLKP